MRGAESHPEDILTLHRFQVVEEGEVGVRVIGEAGLGVLVESERDGQGGSAVYKVVDRRGKGLSGVTEVIK